MTPYEAIAVQVIDTWLDYRYRYGDLPGFQVCIRNKGKVIFSKAYGYADLSTQRRLITSDLFRIASQSKPFTACAILMLQEQKKLSIQEPALNYLPELKNHKDKRFQLITIRDLMTHRSGLFRDGLDCSFFLLNRPFPSREQLIQEVLSSDLVYNPNTITKYSNIGYALLGMILEQIMQQSYSAVIQKLIFDKLNDNQIYVDLSDDLAVRLANGYSRPLSILGGKRTFLEHTTSNAYVPGGGFCANTESTSLFFNRLLLGTGLINQSTQKELLSLSWPVENLTNQRYGLGMMFDKFGDLSLVGHSGGYPGFVSQTRHWLGTEYVISFCINANDTNSFHAIGSIAAILNLINKTFSDTECEQATVCGPMSNEWGSMLLVLTPHKGLYLNIESWLPCDEALILEGNKDGTYICKKERGFGYIGEKICFTRDERGQVISMTWGSLPFSTEQAFLEKYKIS